MQASFVRRPTTQTSHNSGIEFAIKGTTPRCYQETVLQGS